MPQPRSQTQMQRSLMTGWMMNQSLLMILMQKSLKIGKWCCQCALDYLPFHTHSLCTHCQPRSQTWIQKSLMTGLTMNQDLLMSLMQRSQKITCVLYVLEEDPLIIFDIYLTFIMVLFMMCINLNEKIISGTQQHLMVLCQSFDYINWNFVVPCGRDCGKLLVQLCRSCNTMFLVEGLFCDLCFPFIEVYMFQTLLI